jgi:hypothetical protein
MLLKSSDKLINRVSKGVLRHPLQVLPFQHRNQQKSVGQNLWVVKRVISSLLTYRFYPTNEFGLKAAIAFIQPTMLKFAL